ncbi:60S ribosomal protein l23-like [Trifolium pratense]|uniref:60S ribosomal protein l23-like n=1 Tax=Trifolium pratense TaxID=57577 RepID=A0A2K3JM02_TRIPR|nr:60S ribosomal protein l23-like [Trifolium pratense]
MVMAIVMTPKGWCLHVLQRYSAGVIVNPKGEMKGSAIIGPIGQCADLWPRIASAAYAIVSVGEFWFLQWGF